MKTHVRTGTVVAGARRFGRARVGFFNRHHVLARASLGCKRSCFRFDSFAQFGDEQNRLETLADPGVEAQRARFPIAHERTAALPRGDQAFVLQTRDRLADDGAADPELHRHGLLRGQTHVRLQLAGADAATQLARHLVDPIKGGKPHHIEVDHATGHMYVV
jgi:hypothetical protein